MLSFLYSTVAGSPVGFGVACVWNGPGDSPLPDYPAAGVILLTAGILVVVFFPRLVERLTRGGVLTSPHTW